MCLKIWKWFVWFLELLYTSQMNEYYRKKCSKSAQQKKTWSHTKLVKSLIWTSKIKNRSENYFIYILKFLLKNIWKYSKHHSNLSWHRKALLMKSYDHLIDILFKPSLHHQKHDKFSPEFHCFSFKIYSIYNGICSAKKNRTNWCLNFSVEFFSVVLCILHAIFWPKTLEC